MAAEFHRRTGSLVSLSNGNRTAQRNHPAQEFNNGVVLSLNPLKDNQLFEVKIDRKVNSWSGSIEIGVTSSDPLNLSFPTSATGFHEGTWVMSGCSIMKDGHTTLDEYGQDLDQLAEGDRVGVMRTSNGALHIFVNGIDQGPAANNIPSRVWAVVDMYGKCAQVTVVDDANHEVAAISNELVHESLTLASNELTNDKLVFHERHGTLIKLSNNRRIAERRRPLDEFNNGIVMTNRPLRNDELFEIRLERLVDKWSGSIEVGITTHNPNILDFPATMTNMRSGTIMMSGSGILTNGKGTRRQYGEFNLDELQEGDRIGLIRKANGTLHYYINGIDQGVAATKVPQTVWGVVDLYGMAVKVAVLEVSSYGSHDDRLINRANSLFHGLDWPRIDDDRENISSFAADSLLFHSRCGMHAAVINNQRTAHRPNAMDDFNNAVVMTNRVLRSGEMFEVVIDRMVDKWAGSIEIGVTTHSPLELEFPSTMTNVRSGTWMMTGNGVMHNGTTILEEYGQNLDQLKVGDCVGVVCQDSGILHFFINGIDQGPAASGVSSNIYGVIDLYGQAAQATIVDPADLGNMALRVMEFETDELRFNQNHGQNAIVSADGKTAFRPSARGEFNDAIVMSNRPLNDNEMFEVRIDKMVERWSGSIEAGLTLVEPDDINFPSTMTDISFGTWMLSGSAIMQDGSTVKNGYRLDLDALRVGSCVGMMRCSDGTLHYYLNGVDQGVACSGIPSGVFAVIDLYGQCAQVTITSGSGIQNSMNYINNSMLAEPEPTLVSPSSSETTHRFSRCAGKNIEIRNNGTSACRLHSYNQALTFSCDPVKADELFEVKVDSMSNKWAGSLQVGLTTMAISDSTSFSLLPSTATDLKAKATWIITGSEVRKNGITIKENYCPSLERLSVGNRIGIRRSAEGNMHLILNGEDMGVAATNIPKNVFAVVDLYGFVDSVSIISNNFVELVSPVQPSSSVIHGLSSEVPVEMNIEQSLVISEFHENHGTNISLRNGNQTAERVSSYNQGLVFSSNPLPRNHLFQVKIDRINPKWSASLVIGVLGFSPDKWTIPCSALNIKKLSWLFHSDSLYRCGTKIREGYGTNLDSLTVGQTVGIKIDDDSVLHLVIDGSDLGAMARDLPSLCYAVVDLYGQCEQVAIVTCDGETVPLMPVPASEDGEKADKEDGQKEKHSLRQNESTAIVLPNCEFQNVCARFKATLGLPETYFTSESSYCYCDACSKLRGDIPYWRKGEPPRDYAQPIGWCKFNLRMQLRPDGQNVFDKWHVGFHGTRPGVVRKLLDSGDLLVSNKSMVGGITSCPKIGHLDEKNIPEEQLDFQPIVLSPTIRYAGCQQFAPAQEYRDPKTKKIQHMRVALQVCIKPGSYKVGPQSIGTHEQFDPKFSNNEVEWSTKERGATSLCALLIKVE